MSDGVKRTAEGDAPKSEPPVKRKATQEYDFASMLRIFYSRVYPFEEMFRWLSYGDPTYFNHREWSMTFQGDIYARYQCYKNSEEFGAAIKKSCPIKIDIGAVFNKLPSEHRANPAGLVPLERELVFDIDLTDYDDVRTCCQKTDVCEKCFTLMAVAVRVLDDLLRNDFGFKHLLWVFSGRRGIHCWVCDESARKLSNAERAAVAEFLNIPIGKSGELNLNTSIHKSTTFAYSNYGVSQDLSSQYSRLHPSFHRAYNKYVLPSFERNIVEDHLDFTDEKVQEELLRNVPHDVGELLKDEWKTDKTRIYKWQQYKATMIQCFQNKSIKGVNPVIETVFRYAYPRLDINVSKGLNHLLKAPFVVHPSTGNVCVPLNPKKIEEFDLAEVPRLVSIIKQLDSGKGVTDMDNAVAGFRSHFLDPMDKDTRGRRAKEHQEAQIKSEGVIPMEI